MRTYIGLVVLAVAASQTAFAEGEGNTIRGSAYAQAMCSTCHAIGLTDASPNPAAPPLRAVNLKTTEGKAFAEWLNLQHTVTANVVDHQATDIISYMAALKAGKTE